jgi:dTMP kinase
MQNSSQQNGKIIVFEGIDGSGKETQFNKAIQALKERSIPFTTFDFPQYDKTPAGKVLRKILDGDLGINPADVPIKILSSFFSLDRAEAAPQIKEARKQSKLILLNRYWTSNLGCQAGKFKTLSQREEYINWLYKLEIKEFGLPQEDRVIFFDMSLENSLHLIKKRCRKNDQVEINREYLKTALKTYRWLAKKFNHWITLPCERKKKIKSKEEIHQEVLKILDID